MKFTIALLLFATLHVSAKSYSQDRITLKLQETELKTALKQIEKKSIYRFLYNDDVISAHRKVNVNATNALVTDVLNGILNETSLTYKVLENNLVVITQKNFVLQETKVTGKVKGTDGQPIPSVTVRIKGSNVATVTDATGSYSISAPDGGTLVFSSVGYLTQEVAVGGRTEINVVLQIAAKDINEVVVIGYGQASKRDLTGSIAKVSGKDVADKPNTNPVASLQGRVAGLSIVNNGTPGAEPDIRIRGTVSIGQVHPLYVVDGIFNDNINYLNPNDIESIEVLKDPSSLAIFGVKGATGVIAITTKKAKAGTTVINFNTAYGTKKLVDKIKWANADQFKTLFAQERLNNGITDPFDYTGLTANTDWIDAVTRSGKFNTNNLSISTSSEKNRFNFGFGYLTDEGVVKNEVLKRLTVSIADEFKLNKAIKFGVNLNVTREIKPYDATAILDDARKVIPQISSGTKNFRVANPYNLADTMNVDIYSGLDVGLQSSGVVNPLLRLQNEWNKKINVEYRSVGSIFGEVTFLKNFTLRSTMYADISSLNDRQYTPLYYAYNPKDNTPYIYSPVTRLVENDNDWRKFQQDHILTFRKSMNDHNITATAGFTTYYFSNLNRTGRVSQSTAPTAQAIPDDPRFWYVNSGFQDPTTTSVGGSQSEYSTVSYLARVLYNYKGKYFLNASFRNDASSRLPAANRNQKFWAVGAAWELTKEKFMADQRIVDYLKLKGSVGVLGNQTASRLDGTPLNYPFYPNLNSGSNAVFGTTVYTAADPEYIPNPNLKWETVSAQEIGIELNAFNNRLHFEANYFNKTTNDLMTYVDRSSIGLKNELVNGGSIRNWGTELTASWTQVFNRDLSLNIGGNITFMKNEVIKLSDELPTGILSRQSFNNGSAESRTTPGQPIGYFYGYVVEGLYQSITDILRSPDASSIGSYGPGDFKFKDVNGDGVITSSDKTYIGNPTPKFTYGTYVNLTYKGFNLSVDMNGVYGNQIFRTYGSLESPFQRVNYPAFKTNSWTGAGTSNWDPIISQGHRFNYNGSTYNMEDGSYFRIRNLQLGYNFASTMLAKAKIKNLRVFANIQNLKTWKHNTGYTAEYGGDATAFGYDNAGGAIPRVTTFGLNVTF
ncbi:MAG: TonB-dependent receptor [Chitinophagaceae bacterium]|nr:TonB-dependent receptor [Chitinophagaceae bacterium]